MCETAVSCSIGMGHAGRSALLTRLALLCVSACMAAHALQAQPLTVSIIDIDGRSLPKIHMKVGVMREDRPALDAGAAQFELEVNGAVMPISGSCPDPTAPRYIALVLDNSGSMSGQAFDSMRIGAHNVIDSLRPNDAVAVYDFVGPSGRRVLDYTTDRIAARTAINMLTLGASTPLLGTIDLALTDLLAHAGRRIMIVFTDGVNNQVSRDWMDVRDDARAGGVVIHAIGFGSMQLTDDMLTELAETTGGRYMRIHTPAQIAELFRNLASEIASPWCVLTWDAGCTDSIRLLHLTARIAAERSVADTLWVGPHRPDTLSMRIIAPRRLGPGQQGIVYVALSRPLHMDLPLSFSFLLRHDPTKLEPTSVQPVTIGTICQNTVVRVQQLQPGILRFSGEFLRVGLATTHLVGIALRARSTDSSGMVVLTLDSLSFAAGCANIVQVTNDTLEICSCELAGELPLIVDGPVLLAGELRVRLAAGAVRTGLVRLHLSYDPKRLILSRIEGAAWESDGDDGSRVLILRLEGGDPLLVFTPRHAKDVASTDLYSGSVTMYARCCTDAPSDSALVLLDGECERVLLRIGDGIRAAWPDPASGDLQIRVRSNGAHGRLDLYGIDGDRIVSRLVEMRPDSEEVLTMSVQDVTPGRYFLVFTSGATRSIRPVSILR